MRCALAAALAAAATGCSLAFPGDQTQCATTSDCTARGGAFAGSVCEANVCVMATARDASLDGRTAARPDARSDAKRGATDAQHDSRRDSARDAISDAARDAGTSGDWSCLGHVTLPDAGGGTVRLKVPYVDLLSGSPIPGLRVQACLRLDPTCERPLTDAGFTNDAGLATLSVPAGYNGFVLSTWDASLPSLVYIDPPVARSTTEPPEYLISKDTISILASAVGDVDGSAVVVEPQDGILFLGAYDCRGAPAAGVHFSLAPHAPSALPIYIVGSLPSLTATATDPSGNGAYVNVPVGSVTITATLAATGQTIASVTGFSEASRISLFSLLPEPPP